MSSPSRLTSFSLLAVACLTIMVGCVIVPGLPRVAQELGVPHAASWLVTVPSLGVVLFGPLAGWAIDRFGAYAALCVGLVLYGLLGAGGCLLHGQIWVFADRFALGGATALVMAAGTGLISSLYAGTARMTMIARQGMSIELGGVIFLAVGGVLAQAWWALPFGLYLIAWLLLGLVFLSVPRPGLGQEEQSSVTAQPQSGSLTNIYATALVSMILFFTAIIMLPFSLHRLGLVESQTGYFLAFVSLIAVGGAALMPRLTCRFGQYFTLALGFGGYGIAHLLFSFAESLPSFIVGGIFMGLGFGLTVPLVNHITVELSPVARRGRNLAYLSMAIFSGQFLSSFMDSLPFDKSIIFLVNTFTAALFVGYMIICQVQQRLRALG